MTPILKIETLGGDYEESGQWAVVSGRGSGGGDPSAGKERPPQDDKRGAKNARLRMTSGSG